MDINTLVFLFVVKIIPWVGTETLLRSPPMNLEMCLRISQGMYESLATTEEVPDKFFIVCAREWQDLPNLTK